jgi:hypothetical protein
LKEVKEHIKLAQEKMKELYDGKHREEEFEEGDWVFLKLQPYRQVSVHMRKNAKLSTRFFRPFKVIKKMSPIAYKLELPLDSHIHPVFRVSLLKRKLGGDQIVLPQLPEMIEEGHMFPKPQAILGKRVKKNKKMSYSSIGKGCRQWSQLGRIMIPST